MTPPRSSTQKGLGPDAEPRPVTCDQVTQRFGPGRHDARERYDELSMREQLARAYATLRAHGKYDPAKHGTGDTEPLTTAEHLEMLAIGEYLARSYKPTSEIHNALRAGATWRQVAYALDTGEAMVRVAYRAPGLTASTTCSAGLRAAWA